ncbi:unannotated protein [freshwater metagenome]|uniref:Unannotated protein n=1 Tax=freshwater metagenome TaxID=449393 RepID=A0A6J7ES10_9ZZZZ
MPVLSSTTVSTARVLSSTCGPLMRIPNCAPRPVPTSSAVGVASPSAQGQAMMSTATAAVNAFVALPSLIHQNASVASDRRITTGTNTPATRSANRCTGALPDWAASTSRAIWASAVSPPTRVARTVSRPLVLTVAPMTDDRGPTSTGTLSPVTSDWSTAEVPDSTMPSVAIFSPGRTTNRWPTTRASIGVRTSSPFGLSSETSFAPSSTSARSADPARDFARASRYRPARMNTTTAEATSR